VAFDRTESRNQQKQSILNQKKQLKQALNPNSLPSDYPAFLWQKNSTTAAQQNCSFHHGKSRNLKFSNKKQKTMNPKQRD